MREEEGGHIARLNNMVTLTAAVVAFFGAISAWLGSLSIPVYLLIIANICDYITGIGAAHFRGECINSYTGMQGIAKKVCMWLLIAVGAVVDWLLSFCGESLGLSIHLPMMAASMVAVWLIINEIISILENIGDIGAPLPKFILNILNLMKNEIEEDTKE